MGEDIVYSERVRLRGVTGRGVLAEARSRRKIFGDAKVSYPFRANAKRESDRSATLIRPMARVCPRGTVG